MAVSPFEQAFIADAAAEIAAFKNAVISYTPPGGSSPTASGVDAVIDYDPADDETDLTGETRVRTATARTASADVTTPVPGGSVGDGTNTWAVETVESQGGIHTFELERNEVIERSATGKHRMGRET